MRFKDIIVLGDQTLVDVAIQEYGSAGELFRLLRDNPQLLTADAELTEGQVLKIQLDPDIEDKRQMEFFRNNKLMVATGASLNAPGVPGNLTGRRVATGSRTITVTLGGLLTNLIVR